MKGIAGLALDVGRASSSTKSTQVVDIITFVESTWGLNQKLFPVQRIILKAHYGLALDDNPHGFDIHQPIPQDHPLYHEYAHQSTFPDGTPDPDDPENGYYKYRVVFSDFRRQNWQVMTEAQYLRYLHSKGRSNIKEVIPGVERREMILSIGRRSGKTHIASCIAAYETYKLIQKGDPQGYYGLPSGEVIGIISVATDKEQAGILYSKVSGYYKECPFFASYTANNTMSYARFQTPKDIERYGRYAENETANATIRVTFRPCRAKGLRGPGNLVIIMDELAHFHDEGQSSAKDVYDAVTPSISAFSPKDQNNKSRSIGDVEGRVISISSPLGKQGQFYALFQIAMRGGLASTNMLAIQAPTWEVNPSLPASEFEKHYLKDPVVFFTEYGGEFTDRTKGWIENEDDLISLVDPSLKPATRGPSRRAHFVGIDFGLAGNGSAIAIGHMDAQGRIVLDLMDYIRAGEGKYVNQERLDFDEVADWVADYHKKFMFSKGIFDQWAGIPFEQALHKRGLTMLESTKFSPQASSEIYRNFKDMMWDKRMVLYDWPKPQNPEQGEHCPYLMELLELQAEYKTQYIVNVAAPQVPGKYDDMSMALVRMVWMASQHMTKPTHIAGTRPAGSQGSGRMTPTQLHRAALKLKQPGGSSPDRQPSRMRPGSIRGRF